MITQQRDRSLSRAIREADRAGKILTKQLVAELDAQVAAAYRTTQDRVGVESGALKATGRSGAEVRDDNETYVAYIAYGSDAPPVTYALYHLAVNEPWFEAIPETEALMEATISAHIARHLR